MLRRARRLGPTALLRSQATTKGLLGGSRMWRTIWAVLIGGSVLRRTFGKFPELLIDEPLKPGERMEIRTFPAPTRAERKAAKHAAKHARRSR
jgi:hypothetical protein